MLGFFLTTDLQTKRIDHLKLTKVLELYNRTLAAFRTLPYLLFGQSLRIRIMEVVSAAASVGALVEISLKVTSLCAEYYTQVKSAGNDINRFRLEVQALANVLQSLQKLAEKPAAEKLLTARSLTGSIESCLRDLKGLKEKLDPGRGRKAMSRYGVRALKWPFVGKELEKTIIILERHKSTFNTALNTDQTYAVSSDRNIQNKLTPLAF